MQDTSGWEHTHAFVDLEQGVAERRTYWVIGLTAVTMLVELVAGGLTGSMALLADGWHMATHVGALGIAALAYYITRRHAHDPRFTFGTGKVATLGGFTSAVVLGIVALLMALESLHRLLSPAHVAFGEAMVVAWVGLVVNLLSAWMLGHGHDHGHDHTHAHEHAHHHADEHQHHADEHRHHAVADELHHDHNLRAAYLHVLADALTSILAIVALWCGAHFGWVWMDPAMGIVGAVVIARWSRGLLLDTGRILLDAEDLAPVEQQVRTVIESDQHDQARIADLHVWRVGPRSLACIVSLVNHGAASVHHYKTLLDQVDQLDHVTVEVLVAA